MLTKEELAELFKQAMQDAITPLHNEIEALRDELKAIEIRQEAREAAHFDLVDERLKEIKEEARKGFWSRLFRK